MSHCSNELVFLSAEAREGLGNDALLNILRCTVEVSPIMSAPFL